MVGSVGGEGKEGQRSRVTPGGGRERGGKKRWGKAIHDIYSLLKCFSNAKCNQRKIVFNFSAY